MTVVWSLNCVWLCDLMDCSIPGFLSFTISQSLFRLISIESMMPSNHLIPYCPFLLLPTIFPSIRVFSNGSALHIRWPKYWSFSFRISPSNESFQFSSVAQSYLFLCDPMDCSMPGFPIHHYSQACSNSCPSSRWCHPNISSSVIPFSSCLQSFSASGSFPVNQFFASGGQSIGVSASASAFLMSIQGLFPLWSSGLISLLSKGLSRIFSSTTVQIHQFFGAQLSL